MGADPLGSHPSGCAANSSPGRQLGVGGEVTEHTFFQELRILQHQQWVLLHHRIQVRALQTDLQSASLGSKFQGNPGCG